MDTKKLMRTILGCIKYCLFTIAVLCLIRQFTDDSYNELGGVLAALVIPFVPDILHKLFKTKLSVRIEFVYYLFIFLSVDLGTLLHCYDFVPHYDKAVHFLSGVITAVAAYYILQYYGCRYKSKSFRMIFIVSVVMAIAALWEIYEFSVDLFLAQETQHGLDDTMWDMIMAFFGGLLGSYLFIRKKPQLLIAAEEQGESQAGEEEKSASSKSKKKSKK